MSIYTVVLLLLTMLSFNESQTEARILTQCEAVRELTRSRTIMRSYLSSYVCIMKSESNMDTRKLKGPGHKSSYSYGIFQISSDKWCSRYRAGGICNKNCNDFLDDDIQDDIACAKIIVDTDGFYHWKSWETKCASGRNLPNLSGCSIARRDLINVRLNMGYSDEDELTKPEEVSEDYKHYDVVPEV